MDPTASEYASTIWSVGSELVKIAGPPTTDPQLMRDGMWADVVVSPDGKTLLANWRHPCDSAHAFFIPAGGGRPRVVTGERDWQHAPVSYAEGWTRVGLARVSVLRGGDCGGRTFRRPGLYLIDPVSGKGTFARRLKPREGGVAPASDETLR